MNLVFLASRGEDFGLGPETRLVSALSSIMLHIKVLCSSSIMLHIKLLCSKVLLKCKGIEKSDIDIRRGQKECRLASF